VVIIDNGQNYNEFRQEQIIVLTEPNIINFGQQSVVNNNSNSLLSKFVVALVSISV